MTTAFGDRELQVEIGFDCALALTHSRRSSPNVAHSVSLSTASALVQKPVNGFALVPQGINALCVNMRGALLARASGGNKLILLPPRSLVFVRGGTKLSLQAARGEHADRERRRGNPERAAPAGTSAVGRFGRFDRSPRPARIELRGQDGQIGHGGSSPGGQDVGGCCSRLTAVRRWARDRRGVNSGYGLA